MNYTFKGKLCGYICEECSEPLSRVKVRLYRSRSEQNVTALAVAAPKDTFVVLSDEEAQAKASSLIAEVETDDSGQFVFELGEKQGYSGEIFEVDVYCGTVPHRPPGRKEPKPLQFSITTIHPMWRETDHGFVAGWEYCISQRYWCWILRRFEVWVICGRVVVCGTQTPIPGVKVSAFDVDWLQDDALGTALTDANGRFAIYYAAATFKKGTVVNVELVGGPDIYFKIATTGGIPLLNEDPSRGRKPDRENRGNCFCVELCLDKDVVPPPIDVPPSFTHVGVVKIQTQIDSGTGLTIGDHRAFYSTLRLYGTVPKKLNGNQTEYMFDVAEYSGNVLGAAVPIKQAQIARTVIGQRMIFVSPPPPLPPHIQVDDWTVNGNPGELMADFTSDGWIKVPQDSNFYPNTGPQPALIRLISESLAAFGTVNQAGIHAGSSSTPLAKDRYFQIRMWVRSSTSPQQIAGTCVRIAIDNTLYDNITHGGSWAPQNVSGQLGVSMVDIGELVGNGCGGIGETLTVLYTSAHPNLGSVSLSMNGPGGPYAFTLSPDPGASPENQFGTAMLKPPAVAKNLTPCAYIVTLSTQVLLTNGDGGPGPLDDVIGFCKK